jgi:YVTN family beta-propeller protein
MEAQQKCRSRAQRLGSTLLALAVLTGWFLIPGDPPVRADHLTGCPATYTLDADFDEGTLINVVHDPSDQLQLDDTTTPFPFIWVAASARGTIVKINTLTGSILGEYLSAPAGRGRNPSRTTVDFNGNVWAGNRNETSGNQGSVVQIGLEENGQCVDRNGNGIIDTSTGLGDILPWPDITDGAGGVTGLVQDAADECILVFQRLPNAPAVRHVSVDGSNDVWVGGYPFGQRMFYKLDGSTGQILASFNAAAFGCGGYGGLVDGNGILWSASISQSRLLRYDPGTGIGSCIGVSNSYGLGIDTNGFIWNSMWVSNSIVKVSPAGVIQPTFPKTTGGSSSDRGVAVTPADNHVWVANSGGSDVSRLDNNGIFVAVIPVGNTPTGVAVDAAGKVWVTNLSSNTVSRINPAINAVDLTVNLGAGAGPYNYSDMTGSILIGAPNNGTWTIVHDSGLAGQEWGTVSWNSGEPGDSSITVTASSSEDGVIFGPVESVTDGVDLTVANGRFLKVSVSFARATTGETPILYDLTIDCATGCLTRSAGFWGNRPAITAEFLPVTSCGIELISTLPYDQGSATEDLCKSGKDFKNNDTSPQQLQLIRQCTAAALNIAATRANRGNCESEFRELAALLAECCEGLCNSGAPAAFISESGCIEDMDLFNNSDDTLDPVPDLFLDPGPADPGSCSEANGNGFVNAGRALGPKGLSGVKSSKAEQKAAKAAEKAAKKAAKAAKKAAKEAAKQ